MKHDKWSYQMSYRVGCSTERRLSNIRTIQVKIGSKVDSVRDAIYQIEDGGMIVNLKWIAAK